MRTLIITAAPPPRPERDVHGLYRRLALFVRALGRISDELELVHFGGADHPPPSTDEQSRYWGVPVRPRLIRSAAAAMSALDVVRAPWRASARPRFLPVTRAAARGAVNASLQARPDLILVHRLAGMLAYGAIPASVRRACKAPLLFDLDDVEHRVKGRIAAEAHGLSRWTHRAQVPGLYAAERAGAARAERTFVCSEADRHYLLEVGIRHGIAVVPNAVAMPPTAPAPARAETVLFLGAYHYEPNARAAERLATKIWPLVRAARPDARLILAGDAPQAIPCFGNDIPGVEFTGFVPDLARLYEDTRVVCCPLEIGGGTRVKLVEAAGFGRAIVSTRLGAEGLDFIAGREIVLADDDPEIAAACVTLLADREAAHALGLAARERALARYERTTIEKTIVQHAHAVLDAGEFHPLPSAF